MSDKTYSVPPDWKSPTPQHPRQAVEARELTDEKNPDALPEWIYELAGESHG